MSVSIKDLETLIEKDGGIDYLYRKLLIRAHHCVAAAKFTVPESVKIATLSPEEIVQEAFERLFKEGCGERRPYYALRNFVQNKVRTLVKSPKMKVEVPIGGNSEEWNEFWEINEDETSPNPGKEAEWTESANLVNEKIVALKNHFQDNHEIMELLTHIEKGLGGRAEILANSTLSGPSYDKALKRVQYYTATRLMKGLSHA